jgi:protoporphyrinogen oxidase
LVLFRRNAGVANPKDVPMRLEKVHTLILGAGPAGLAAGHTLAQAEKRPVVLERDGVCGGLMRSFRHQDFVVDVGRKELYNRLERVDAYWSSLLGEDYRTYPHRGGFLYEGKILEMSPAFRGPRRGMPLSLFVACAMDFLWTRARPRKRPPQSVEEYFYQTRGRKLTRLASQGFQEKLTGVKWADLPLPQGMGTGNGAGFLATVKAALERAFSKKEVNTFKGVWRHPAKGTGQICDRMADAMIAAGGTIHYRVNVTSIGTSGDRVQSVVAELPSGPVTFEPEHVISSVPLELLLKLCGRSVPPSPQRRGVAPAKRMVVLVYLFLDREPNFPHAWLQVTCPSTRIGRITNYSAFNGEMVPAGKGCLCCEYYCFGDDPLLALSEAELVQATVADCVRSRLIDASSQQDARVLKLPGADASQNRDNWMNDRRLKLLAELAPLTNLYCVNRTETDIATLAGMESAEAILSTDRRGFNLRLDPSKLQIRSASKAFAFEVPVEQIA